MEDDLTLYLCFSTSNPKGVAAASILDSISLGGSLDANLVTRLKP